MSKNYTRSDMYQDLSTEKVNWDVMFQTTEPSNPVISVRARPYKTDRQTGRMVLAGGRTLDEAFAYAQLGLISAQYIPLDWSQRAIVVGIQQPSNGNPLRNSRRISAEDLTEALNDGTMTETMGVTVNEPPKGAEKK